MPSQSSIYRKIQVVLDLAKSVKVHTLAELQAEVKGQRPPNFLSRRYDDSKDAFVLDVSDKSIRRTVAFCQLLGLLNQQGSLTKEGRQALRPSEFDTVIAVQIRSYLRREDVDLSSLNSIILEGLQNDTPVIPTCRYLWENSGQRMNYGVFSRILTLLAQCGGAQSSQKRMYLRFNEVE